MRFIHLCAVLAVTIVAPLVVNAAVGDVVNKLLGRGTYETVKTDDLEAVLIFMRHGVRAPWTSYPKDPNNNQTNRWPNGRSQLTEFGIKQATNIGNLLNKRYGSFTKNLKRKQIYLRASAAQRCIDTLKLISARLWPNFDDAHTPVIYSLPKKIDSLLYEEPKCPAGDNEETYNMNRREVQDYEKRPEIRKLYSYVAEHTGLPATMAGVTKAFDCVRCDKINGFKTPKWANDTIYDQMGDVYTKNLNFLYSSEKARRIRAGPILQEVIDTVNALKSASPSEKDSIRRAYLYTTHDYKIAALLMALGEKLQKYPPFLATVIFEVRKNKSSGNFDIKAFYISQTVKEPYTIERLSLSNCPEITAAAECKLRSFDAYLRPYKNVNWASECGLAGYDAIQLAEDNIGDS